MKIQAMKAIVTMTACIAVTWSMTATAGVDRTSSPGAREVAVDTSEALYDVHLGVRNYWHQGPVGADRPSRRATAEKRDQAAAGSASRIR